MFKFKPWNLDKWNSRSGNILIYDKLEHFLLGFLWLAITYSICKLMGLDGGSANKIIGISYYAGLLVGALWEIKDGIVPWDGIHVEGFSWKDLIADIVGLSLGLIIFGILL